VIVKHPREAALDAQCCASIANLGKQKAQALSTGFGQFSITEFAEKLVCFLFLYHYCMMLGNKSNTWQRNYSMVIVLVLKE